MHQHYTANAIVPTTGGSPSARLSSVQIISLSTKYATRLLHYLRYIFLHVQRTRNIDALLDQILLLYQIGLYPGGFSMSGLSRVYLVSGKHGLSSVALRRQLMVCSIILASIASTRISDFFLGVHTVW